MKNSICSTVHTIASAVLVCLALSGCGEEGAIKTLVKGHLRDPESAQFKDFVLSKNAKHACISYNAKNGLGGYGDWKLAEFVKRAEWSVVYLDTPPSACTEQAFIASDAAKKASDAAMEEAMKAVLAKGGSIDKCMTEVKAYAEAAERLARQRALGEPDTKLSWELKEIGTTKHAAASCT